VHCESLEKVSVLGGFSFVVGIVKRVIAWTGVAKRILDMSGEDWGRLSFCIWGACIVLAIHR
jgi:hypothetical protein